MTLISISTITMMYLLPHRDIVGNSPVWLENMMYCTMYVWVYMPCTFFRMFVMGLSLLWSNVCFFLSDSNVPLQFWLSRGNTSGHCNQSASASPHSCLLWWLWAKLIWLGIHRRCASIWWCARSMGNHRCCCLDVVPSLLVWMDFVIANGSIAVSTVFSIVPGYL